MTRLLATKLYIPRVRSSLVARPRLVERLNQGVQGKLTLISALPGSGKTTLLGEWQASHADGHFPLVWVSLDEGDNDCTRFWSYIARALETLSPGIGEDTLALLHSFPSPPIESVLITLINTIASTLQEDFALVLDDYHCIEAKSIHMALTFLLDNLPPSMHLILITRIDPPLPLARLRVRGQLTEIRTADLRFTPTETVEYLNETMKLHVSLEDATQLTKRTEGWIAGLQLAALSLQGQGDSRDFLQNFNGNHRYVLEYLTQEVLEQQPAHIQRFLQDTAILRRLSAELCDAVIGDTDSQEMLHWLDKANLFLISLDQEQHWYRYHALFRDFLLSSLSKTQSVEYIRALHMRAALWCEQRNLVNEAVYHLLASNDFEQAATFIERIARSIWMRGEASTLQCWLQALPEPLLRSRPQLGLFYVWSLIANNQTEKAQQYLKEVIFALQESTSNVPLEEQLSDEGIAMQAEVIILQATVARFLNDVPRTLELSQQALKYLPQNNGILNSINALNLGHAYHLLGDIGAASEAFKQSITLGRAADNIYTVLLALNNLIQLQIEHGTLHSATEYCRESLQFAARHGCQHLPIMSQTYIEEGKLLYEWNKLEEAEQRLTYGIQLSEHTGSIRFLIQGYMAQARLLQAQGKEEHVHEALAQAIEVARENHSSLLILHIAALQARLWLAEGQLTSAFSWMETCKLSVEDTSEYVYEFEYLTLVRLLMAQGKAKEVVGFLERLRQSALSSKRIGTVIEVLLLQALANYAQHQTTEAFAALERALLLAEPEGYIRLFVDEGMPVAQLLTKFIELQGSTAVRGSTTKSLHAYVSTLLAEFAHSYPTASVTSSPKGVDEVRQGGRLPFMEALGERETEVLRYLAAGLSNQAIAEEMVVALSTVKSHLKSIYRKLDVDSRTHAVARARELHLI